jgi:hypothetical protein
MEALIISTRVILSYYIRVKFLWAKILRVQPVFTRIKLEGVGSRIGRSGFAAGWGQRSG